MLVLLVEHFFTEEGRARFPSWVHEIGVAASRFPGFVDIRQLTRPDAPERSFFALSFAAPGDARRWVESRERQDLLALMAPYRLQDQQGTRWVVGGPWTPAGDAA